MNTFDKAMDVARDATSRACSTRSTASATCCRTSPSCATSPTAASRCSRPSAGRSPARPGLFLDPFYSPGSDFIAIANTYICELIARDRAGQPLDAHAQLYDQIFHSFYESTLALYTDQYPIFGDPEVLPVKVIWDYTYYWGVLAQFFFQRRLTDLAALGALRDELAHCQALNLAVQALLARLVGAVSRRGATRPVMLDQAALPWFAELNRSLHRPPRRRRRSARASARRRGRCARSRPRSARAPKRRRRSRERALRARCSPKARASAVDDSTTRRRADALRSEPVDARRARDRRRSGDDAQADALRGRRRSPPRHRSPGRETRATTSVTLSGAQLTSRPPEVCGSVSRSRATGGSVASSATSTP